MDVGSKNSYPAGTLSNFTGNRFIIDGVTCNSMEGFLQGLKFKNPEMQEHICSLVGFGAKRAGRKKNWQRDQTLYRKGVPLKRSSREYQVLLDRAYMAMYEQCASFRRALQASGKAHLTHSIGRSKEKETVLTEREFCSRLTKLRDYKGRLR